MNKNSEPGEDLKKKALTRRLGVLASLAVFSVLVSFTHHLVWLDSYPMFIRRTSPGFSEPITNFEEIQEQLWADAVRQYPLTVKALIQADQLSCERACKWAYEDIEMIRKMAKIEGDLATLKLSLNRIVKNSKKNVALTFPVKDLNLKLNPSW